MKIAIQGDPGSFSHEAARRMVKRCAIVPCARSVEVFDLLESGKVPIAVIPIENSLAGSVTEHLDLLLARDVFIQRASNRSRCSVTDPAREFSIGITANSLAGSVTEHIDL